MKRFLRYALGRGGAATALALGALLASGAATAGGTTAGTTISNLATLSYSVGGVSQANIGSSTSGNTSGAGTATTFVVDNKVNLNVVTTDVSPMSAVPGQGAVTTTFTVTNTGNKTLDFSLAAADVSSSESVLGSADTINVNGSCTFVVVGVGAQNYIASLAPDASKTVQVLCSLPAAAANGAVAAVSLKATARANGTSGATALTQSATNTVGAEDIVFADGAGSDDSSRDASFSARSAYKIVTAALTITKSVATVCDPVKGNTGPMNIPGAFVQYTITIANGGSASATLSTIADALDANVNFDPDFIQGTTAASCVSGVGSTPTSAAGSGFKIAQTNRGWTGNEKFLTNASDADGATLTGTNIAIDFSQALPNGENSHAAGELKTGESVTVIYQVQIK